MGNLNEPKVGTRYVQKHQDRARWQHRLFYYLCASQAYKRLSEESPENTARALNLVLRDRPASWAIELIQRERAGRFDVKRIPITRSAVHRRYIDIQVSLNRMSVGTWATPPVHPGPRKEQGAHTPESTMQIGVEDWEILEKIAIQAVGDTVKELRNSFESVSVPGDDRIAIRLGNESKKERQIESLALLLTGRAAPNFRRDTIRRWCDFLRIDIPKTRRMSR